MIDFLISAVIVAILLRTGVISRLTRLINQGICRVVGHTTETTAVHAFDSGVDLGTTHSCKRCWAKVSA